MKLMCSIRIEAAPDGAVHLITERGESIIVRRKEDDEYCTGRAARTTEEEAADWRLLTAEVLPRRGVELALF
jgi:hypothetical protein